LYCDQIVDDASVATDPATIQLLLRRPDGTVETYDVGDLTHLGVGAYSFVRVPPVGTGGTWVARFEHTNPTDAHEWTFEVLESALAGPDAQRPVVGPCTMWTDYDDVVRGHTIPSTLTDQELLEVVEQAIAAASDVLFQLGGRRWPGVCDATVQITGWGSCMIPWPSGSTVAMRAGWDAPGWWAPTGGYASCFCTGTVLTLPGPIVSVAEIRVDGDVLDSASWMIVDNRDLVRVDSTAWIPGDLGDETPRLEIDYSYGGAPPEIGRRAAAVLAWELVLGSVGSDSCRLDRRVKSENREGVSIDFALPGLAESLRDRQTGIPEVDLFVHAHNPNRLTRPARFVVPDAVPLVTRRR
jgi:hypothetical protein